MFYGWWVAITAFFASCFAGATIWYGFTAYFDPLISEFGWSYTAISLAASLRGAEMGLMDIIAGFLKFPVIKQCLFIIPPGFVDRGINVI